MKSKLCEGHCDFFISVFVEKPNWGSKKINASYILITILYLFFILSLVSRTDFVWRIN